MRDYRDLEVWQRARAVVRDTYSATSRFPVSERYGLSAQARRAAVSVAANLAEGTGRRGSPEFARFVDIATGSAYELECHLILASDLGFVGVAEIGPLLGEMDEVKRMLIGLARRLRGEEQASRAVPS